MCSIAQYCNTALSIRRRRRMVEQCPSHQAGDVDELCRSDQRFDSDGSISASFAISTYLGNSLYWIAETLDLLSDFVNLGWPVPLLANLTAVSNVD